MLEVTFYRDGRKRTTSILARGHAKAGAYGEDVVCAAASAILQAARLGLEEHAGLLVRAVQRPGDFRLRWPAKARDDAAVRAIVATAELSIARIAKQYPSHVCIRRRLARTG
ncbi:MAG TPA: ribosomal-processing cysteine protease Prp [Candidatus Tyrphobacter sp.]